MAYFSVEEVEVKVVVYLVYLISEFPSFYKLGGLLGGFNSVEVYRVS